MSKKRSVKVQRIDSDDPFVKYLFPFLVMYSWLHEEEFDEQMATLEADPDGPHSLVYSDIEPFLVMLTVGSSLPLRIALSLRRPLLHSPGVSRSAHADLLLAPIQARSQLHRRHRRGRPRHAGLQIPAPLLALDHVAHYALADSAERPSQAAPRRLLRPFPP